MKFSHTSEKVEVSTPKVKNGNMNAFIYGQGVGGSRYVGNKKKRKIKKR